VYASLWQDNGVRLWTLVNRSENSAEGVLLKVPHSKGVRYFDLVTGRQIGPAGNSRVSLTGIIRPQGIGAFISGSEEALGGDFAGFLARQAGLNEQANFNTVSPARKEKLRPVAHTREYQRDGVPEGMVPLAAAGFNMEVRYRNRECGFYQTPELAESAHPSQGLHKMVSFKRNVRLGPYAIDITPVTNAQFSQFVKAAGYKPKDDRNFLKHWKDGAVPAGLENHPVVYVDLGDARAYAEWASKRLPTEEEWQYAAQGRDGRAYPWGNEWEDGICNGGQTGGTSSVTAFPNARSPFGCYDMCGNVWEWTESERSDGNTRFCIIRGGSFYEARGSHWYADGGPRPCNFAAKFLLMWPGLDRCETVGFRCVVDIADEDGTANALASNDETTRVD
jgi:formylglycine-generating enzyme required for sulfatase activity